MKTKKFGLSLLSLCLCGFITACDDDSSSSDDTTPVEAEKCLSGQTKCNNGSFYKCTDDTWHKEKDCAAFSQICSVIHDEAVCIKAGDEGTSCQTQKDCLNGLECSDKGICYTPNPDPVSDEICQKLNCKKSEYCFLDDNNEPYCSSCEVKCSQWNEKYPVCHEDSGLCVAKNTECAEDESIYANEDKISGFCKKNSGSEEGGGCTSNLDCDALQGLTCNLTTGACEADSTTIYMPVDNEEYCKGTCETNEYCFLDPEDEDQGFCSTCQVNCPAWNALYLVCNEATGYCMAKASCDAGQTVSPNADGYSAICITNITSGCETAADCEQGYTCDLITRECVVEGTIEAPFKYVRVDDLSSPCDGGHFTDDDLCATDDPGADIDAIALVKPDQTTFYAKTVVDYRRSDGVTATIASEKGIKGTVDPTKAVGEPDSFTAYAKGEAHDGKCVYYTDAEHTVHPYVSLGGEGGYLVVEMSEAIEAGDKIDVLEVGKCKLQNTSDGNESLAKAEKIKVQVSVDSLDANGWKMVGTGIGDDFNMGVISFNISEDMLK